VEQHQDLSLLVQPFENAGCNHNINYGMEFAVMFLDSTEEQDFISQIRSHNNRVGRLVSIIFYFKQRWESALIPCIPCSYGAVSLSLQLLCSLIP